MASIRGDRSTISIRATRGPAAQVARRIRWPPSMHLTSANRGSGLPVSTLSALIVLFPSIPKNLPIGVYTPPLFRLAERFSRVAPFVNLERFYINVRVVVRTEQIEVRRVVVISVDANLRATVEGRDRW